MASDNASRRGPGPEGERDALPAGDVELGTYSVERGVRHPVFETVISFDDIVAFEEEDRLERFIAALGQQPGVERAVWEDREIVLVRAPKVADATLETLVARLWAEAGD